MLGLLFVASTALVPSAPLLPSLHRPPPPRILRAPIITAASPQRSDTAAIVNRVGAVVAPTTTFIILFQSLRITLAINGIQVPASIVGMLGGFALLCCLPQKTAKRLEAFFEPACRLFRDWLAAIFSPNFTALPLTMPPVPARDLLTFIAFLIFGFGVTVGTNAAIATALAPRKAIQFDEGAADLSTPDAGPPPTPPNPYPIAQQRAFVVFALLFASIHLFTRDALTLNLCLFATTLGSYSLATTLTPPKLKLWLHPFVTTSAATFLACTAIGAAVGDTWRAPLSIYSRQGSGAGFLISQLMGPCVLSFAFQLYTYRAQLRRRFIQIIGTCLTGSFLAMLTSAAAGRLAGLAPVLRLALVSRNTISPIALETAKLLKVEPAALGLLGAFVTGLLAFPLGKLVLDKLRVNDPAARGLSLAGTAHGGGLLALSDEAEAFPFAALSMNLSAACAVVLLSVPAIRRLVLTVALGRAAL